MFRYFENLPTTVYSNTAVTDITARNTFIRDFTKKTSALLPYTVPDDLNFDMVSHFYYDDVNSHWILYLANDIIDPYFDAPLNAANFDAHINQKYGSYANAVSTVSFWRNNWVKDDRKIDVGTFEALSAGQKKYWSPRINEYNAVIDYRRKRVDDIVTTNKVVSLGVTETFTVDTKVTQTVASEVVATGIVKFSNSSVCIVQHVTGDFEETETETLASGNTTSIVSDVIVLQTNIPSDETSYWETVSVYDVENEKNEAKKSIYVIDKSLKGVVEKQFRTLMGK